MLNPIRTIYSVSDVNELLRISIENEPQFNLMLIKGEIVNYKRHSSGHVYFAIKDNDSRLKCVMFKSQSRSLEFRPENGNQVLIQGRLSVYSRNGEYQIYVDAMYPLGQGDLHQKWQDLKEKMEQEGLFDPEHKQKLPSFPLRIGVITSPTGAAIHDITETIHQRFPPSKIILAPVRVQGDQAGLEIAQAIQLFNRERCVDLLIVGRGGGAPEDLWAFNEEVVIRAIYDSAIPIISAVGHEVDTTLADFAADQVAATPTAAAVLAVPELTNIWRDLDAFSDKIDAELRRSLRDKRLLIEAYERHIQSYSPSQKLQRQGQQLDFLLQKLNYNINYVLRKQRSIYDDYRLKLMNMHPQRPLAKGFAMVFKQENGQLVTDQAHVQTGDQITIRLNEGTLIAKVLAKEIPNNKSQ